MTIEETYRKYAEIKTQMRDLTAQAEILSEAIKIDIVKGGNDAVRTNLGDFYTTSRKIYQYSDDVEAIEDALQVAQEKERREGVATVLKETVSLVFRPLKD